MNIMFEDSITDEVRNKYTLLPLDTFYFTDIDTDRIAYCLIENTPLTEIMLIEQLYDLHKNLMKNFYLRNWKFCEDAIEHLVGKWNGEVDTFYQTLTTRINHYKNSPPGPEWDGRIIKS